MAKKLRIGFLGGVPSALGGGGLELQMERTAAALVDIGHEVVRLEAAPATVRFELVHAFGAEPGTWHALRHWSRNRTPLVVTPVIVVSPGWEERWLRLSARLPLLTAGRMKRDVVRLADVAVAGTRYEAGLLEDLAAKRVEIVGNAADPVEPATTALDLPAGFALMLGSVSQRKRQLEGLESLDGRFPLVIAGGVEGSAAERERWEEAVRRSGAVWLGEVRDRALVARLLRDAVALVHLSGAEVQSLAVLEALTIGTPAVLSDIPSHRELWERHPRYVRLVAGPREAADALEELRAAPPTGPPPAIPTWADAAGALENVYLAALA
jgi:glycosyltransferase involved in cell wall biosynthesis